MLFSCIQKLLIVVSDSRNTMESISAPIIVLPENRPKKFYPKFKNFATLFFLCPSYFAESDHQMGQFGVWSFKKNFFDEVSKNTLWKTSSHLQYLQIRTECSEQKFDDWCQKLERYAESVVEYVLLKIVCLFFFLLQKRFLCQPKFVKKFDELSDTWKQRRVQYVCEAVDYASGGSQFVDEMLEDLIDE